LAKLDSEYLNVDKRKGGFIVIIYRNSIRLHTLIKDILDITRIESNTLILNKERFNILDIIYNSVKDISSHCNNINYMVNISLEESVGPSYVVADRARIYQVVSNLLTNAVTFTKTGTIIVNAKVKENTGDGQIIVSVRDTGSGIVPEIAPRLFTKFASKSDSGAGLGLYLKKYY